jgi:hypothetical protein
MFKPNYQISIISGCGLAGIIAALLFFSVEKGPATGSVFHEVGYFPRDVVDRAIQHFTDSLDEVIKQKKADKKDITEDSTSLVALNADKVYYEDSTLTDTNAIRIVTNWVHFGLQPNLVAKWDSAYQVTGSGWRDSVRYTACFPAQGGKFVYKGFAQFKIIPYKSNFQFMAKYPEAASWVFLMVMLCGFCFISIPACIYIMEQVLLIFKKEERPRQKGYWVATPIVAGCLIVFLVVLFETFSDEPPVKDLFFMRTLGNLLQVVNVLGCVAGAFCLAGFIHSASMLGYFADKVTAQATKVKEEREEVKKSDEEAKHKEYADQFRRLLGFFHRYFILSAILLSLVVLCTGALYNAANALSFLKLVRVNWGYSPAGGDAVYLFGGLFTAILLLVFLPAKMQFGDVELRLPRDKDSLDDDNKWYGLLEQPFSWLKGGLIAATPFLSGLVQGLIGLLNRH